jgi:phage terminase small subunit
MPDKKKPDLYIIEGDSEAPKPKATAKKRRLTAKQERFISEVIKGSTQADAYRTAYEAKGMKPSAIYTEANRLMGNPEIARRLQANRDSIQRSAVSSALSRRRWIVERLEHEAANAESDAARVRSLELLGKTTDIKLFADIVETSTNDSSPEQVKAELEQKLTALLSGSG